MIVCLSCFSYLHPNLYDAYRKQIGNPKRVHYYNDFLCFNCQQDYMVEIDDLFWKDIVTLNRNGYKTKYCCSGHSDKEPSTGYIYFEHFVKLNSHPDGWCFDKSPDGSGKTTIRYDLRKQTEKQKTIEDMMISLHDWIVNELKLKEVYDWLKI
jgi:hypothetical protein